MNTTSTISKAVGIAIEIHTALGTPGGFDVSPQG